MSITNKERQQKLDVEKWLLSEKLGYDKAGGMDWCTYCIYTQYADNQNGAKCNFIDNGRNGFPCARAYNRMKKAEVKIKYCDN